MSKTTDTMKKKHITDFSTGNPVITYARMFQPCHTLDISGNFLGFSKKVFDIFNKGKDTQVDDMEHRVDHKKTVNREALEKNFWREFKRRGFKIDPNNDGHYYPGVKHAKFNKKADDTYEIHFDKKTKFNIVSAKAFMKTVAQIEGMVKYRLFK